MPPRRHSWPYLPRADGELRNWLNGFARAIADDPAGYGRSPMEAAMLMQLAQQYEQAYVRARSPTARGEPATAAKDEVRGQVWRTVRPIAMQIKHNRGISDARKVALGIKPLNFNGSPIRPPDRAPLIVVERAIPVAGNGSMHASGKSSGGGGHRLRYSDPMFPTRFAKPPGVVQCQVFVVISAGMLSAKRLRKLPPRMSGRRAQTYHHADDSSGDGLITFVHIATRHVFTVPHEAKHIGMTATYFARWATKRGLTGPWSGPAAMGIV